MEGINNRIYFNNNRTTVIHPEVSGFMDDFNESSENSRLRATEYTRSQLSGLLNCDDAEIFLTAGTSRAIQEGIRYFYNTRQRSLNHLITVKTEHFIVLDTVTELEDLGATVTYLGVDREGLIDLEELHAAFREDTFLVTIMAANNETGVIQPIEKIAQLCQAHGVPFFSDASQFAGKMRCDVSDLRFDGLAFGSHKMYGPKDIGALYIRKNLQNKNISPPTLHNALTAEQIAGFGKAAEIFMRDHWELSSEISRVKNYFEHHLLDIDGLRINGSTRNRIYNTSNLSFPPRKNIYLLLDKFDFAHNREKASYVLREMGISQEQIENSFRFSFGRYNTIEELKTFIEAVQQLP